MHFAYVDDSGTPGGDSLTFTLGCVLVDATNWADVFDNLLDYRRFLKSRFGLPIRAELKANYFIRNGGPFRKLRLGDRARYSIYRGLMRVQPKLGLRTFAVVIRQDVMRAQKKTDDPREKGWEFLLQRLERFTTKDNTQVLLIHDEGDGGYVRKAVRKARRAGTAGSAFGSGVLKRPARLILDDPVARVSRESFFVQLADLSAYAAFRSVCPPSRSDTVVPANMWDELGPARFKAVNRLSGGTPGIVVWPQMENPPKGV